MESAILVTRPTGQLLRNVGIFDSTSEAAFYELIDKLIGGGGGGGSGEPGKDVVVLTDSNFDDLVLNSDDVWLIEFYAPWYD